MIASNGQVLLIISSYIWIVGWNKGLGIKPLHSILSNFNHHLDWGARNGNGYIILSTMIYHVFLNCCQYLPCQVLTHDILNSALLLNNIQVSCILTTWGTFLVFTKRSHLGKVTLIRRVLAHPFTLAQKWIQSFNFLSKYTSRIWSPDHRQDHQGKACDPYQSQQHLWSRDGLCFAARFVWKKVNTRFIPNAFQTLRFFCSGQDMY